MLSHAGLGVGTVLTIGIPNEILNRSRALQGSKHGTKLRLCLTFSFECIDGFSLELNAYSNIVLGTSDALPIAITSGWYWTMRRIVKTQRPDRFILLFYAIRLRSVRRTIGSCGKNRRATKQKHRSSCPGIEPGTRRTPSGNHTPGPPIRGWRPALCAPSVDSPGVQCFVSRIRTAGSKL